jgi:hypothetical protein
MFNSPGTRTVTATYGGNSDYAPSVSAPVTFNIVTPAG